MLVRKKMPCGWIFQQKNDPKNISKMMTNWFIAKKIKVLKVTYLVTLDHTNWTSVETHCLKTRFHENILQRQNTFTIFISNRWVPKSTLKNLVNFMPKPCNSQNMLQFSKQAQFCNNVLSIAIFLYIKTVNFSQCLQ